MSDKLQAMKILLQVVDSGSFSAAARQLEMPLPTISRKVNELEQQINCRILNRSTRQLSLTEAGQQYVASCRHILEQVEEAERLAAGEYAAPRGELVITAPLVYGKLHVVPMLAAFLKQYPDVKVRLMLTDRYVHLLEEHIDVAFRIGELPDSSMIARKLGQIYWTVCASPQYLAEHGIPQHPQDLLQHQCIRFDGINTHARWLFRHGAQDISITIQSRFTVNTAEAAIAAAIAGAGISRVLSYQVVPAIQQQQLHCILENFRGAALPVYFIYNGQARTPQKIRALLDFSVNYYNSAV